MELIAQAIGFDLLYRGDIGYDLSIGAVSHEIFKEIVGDGAFVLRVGFGGIEG